MIRDTGAAEVAVPLDDPEARYDRAPCGLLVTTPDGELLDVNGTLLELTGYAREELVGRRTFAELLTAGGRIYHETHFAPMLRMQDRVHEIAFELARRDGRRLPVLVSAAVERADDGRPCLVRLAVFEATHRREYEQELLRAKQRAEESEHRAQALARTLQSTLIPPSPPRLPGLDVTAAYRPAGAGEEVGGDFYDVFQIGPGDWVVALGDVCGKGVDAAVVTALVRYTVRALTVQRASPAEALHALNDVLLTQGTERFSTAVLVRLRQDEDAWSATLSCGGHPLPLHVSADGEVEPVGRPGSLVGVLPDARFEDRTVRLAAGEVLLAYTDGVTEGRRGREFFGEERLSRVASYHRSAPSVADAVVAEVLEFQEDRPRDDIAVVAVRVPTARDTRAEPGREPIGEEPPS